MIVLNEELTEKKIIEILQYFTSQEKPRLQRLENYYLGKHDILHRTMNDITAPNNKVVINYPSYIVDSFASYLVGSPIVYDGEEEIKQILEYNDVADVDLETVTDSNIFGYGINQLYIDEESQVRFCRVNPKETILLFDNSIEHKMIAAIKFYPINDNEYNVEIYDKTTVTIYHSSNSLSNLEMIQKQEKKDYIVNSINFLLLLIISILLLLESMQE